MKEIMYTLSLYGTLAVLLNNPIKGGGMKPVAFLIA